MQPYHKCTHANDERTVRSAESALWVAIDAQLLRYSTRRQRGLTNPWSDSGGGGGECARRLLVSGVSTAATAKIPRRSESTAHALASSSSSSSVRTSDSAMPFESGPFCSVLETLHVPISLTTTTDIPTSGASVALPGKRGCRWVALNLRGRGQTG